ncbi:MAG: bifunctional phosphoribosyl-AMP cyclohydrolase/phosphoribosyl-ATP diphosphatase HisIE [Bacteroidota bacterium]|nr:bifunctional phosphoribosyl-AMP cyclohydrolase/phosphoribosyl-ATP diphosphatase HisIE [Bacteroidota bacterium]
MKIDFSKNNGLVPVIVQDAETMKVLMLGYMNQEALEKTQKEGLVTFFSRSRQQLWTKGETSGNFLKVKEMMEDCDNDTILVKAIPSGPVCHNGDDTCFREKNNDNLAFLRYLENLINDRKANPQEGSYTCSLFKKGTPKIAQKVGEEAVELVIEAMLSNDVDFRNETADLIYHLLVLLVSRGMPLNDVLQTLKERHSK